MSKTWRCLARSFVRRLYCRSSVYLVALTFCLFLPAVSFGEFSVRVKYFATPGSTNVVYSSFGSIPDEDGLHDVYISHRFGILFQHSSVSSPSSLSGAWYRDILNGQINPIGSGSSFTNSPVAYPRLYSLYLMAQSLRDNGYSGPGLDLYATVGNRTCYNVYFPDIVANVFSSTNSVYRSIVLSHLSSISASVQNIEVNLGGLQSSVDQGNTLSSSILSVVRAVHSNSVDRSSAISSNLVSLSRFVNTNPFVSDFTNSVLSLPDMSGDYTSDHVDYLLDTYAQLDPFTRTVFALQVSDDFHNLNFMHTFKSRFNGDDFNSSVVDALIGDYPEESKRGSKASSSVRTSIKAQLQAWRNGAKQQLNDWKTDLKQDLQAWKTSDETGYLNIKQAIEDGFSFTEQNKTNRLPFTAFQTNFVTRPLTNSIFTSSADIQSNLTANVDRLLDKSDEIWDEFKDVATGSGGGLNVKIVWPLESDEFHVNVYDGAVVRAIQDNIGFLQDHWEGVSDYLDWMRGGGNTNSIDWTPWFEKWVPFADIVTNLYSEYNLTVPSADIASDFINNGFDSSRYNSLPWFQRVEVLLAMIADVNSSVEVADITEDMADQAAAFQNLSTNVVAASSDVVGLFDYVKRFSSSLQSVFGDRAAPLTGDYVLLPAGSWIFDEPLTLRINPEIQNFCRLIMQCIWYLGFLVLLWVVVSWAWGKVVAVLRWLWSMFDV